jgi:hypothetical protein
VAGTDGLGAPVGPEAGPARADLDGSPIATGPLEGTGASGTGSSTADASAGAPQGADSTTTAASGNGTTPRAAAADRSPITLGLLAAGSFADAASSAGGNAGTSTSGESTMKAVLRHFEERGGIAGRPVRAVLTVIEPTTSNYEVALAAACARFTQDNKVAVVLSNIGYYSNSFEGCLTGKRTPHVEGGWGLTDEQDFRRFPGYFTPNMPSYDARFAALLTSGVQTGHLQRGTKVGVVIEECPQIQRAYDAAWKPRARQAGLKLDEFRVDCINGAEDVGQLAQDMQAAQLRFRSNDVSTVMFATYPTEVNVLFFSQAAESQSWRPKYYLDSKSRVGHEKSTGNYPAAQLQNMRGVGWTNALDVSSPTFTSPAQKRCLDIMRKGGVVVQSGLDAELAYSACDPFFLLEAALTTTRGASGYDDLTRGIDSLGTAFRAAGNDGATTFGPAQHYGTSQYATFDVDESCGCVRYTSAFKAWR